jgi:putative ABC transport system permease protein
MSINLINLGGLSLSMAVVLMLTAYCYYELSVDKHHADSQDTFLIANHDDGDLMGIHTPGVLADFLKNEIPTIESVVRISGTWNPPVVKLENRENFETGLVFTEPDFFNLFNFPVLKGDADNALAEPSLAILASGEAMRLFGTLDVIGKTLMIDNKHLMTVGAVIDENTEHSFLQLKMILPISAMEILQPSEGRFTEWIYWDFLTFIQLNDRSDLDHIASGIESIFVNNSGGKTEPEGITLLPLEKVYFSNIDNAWLDFVELGDKTKVIVLLTVAFLILSMAIVNYLNISAYNLHERLPQTGIFKILGASRHSIAKNSFLESILMFTISMWLAVVLAELLYPFVNYYTGMAYPDHLLLSPRFLSISIILSVLSGMIINILPSIKLSKSHPISNLKKEMGLQSRGRSYQGALVVFQFCAAIILISFTILVHKQIKFGSSGLGFNEENIISIKMTNQLKKEVLKEKLMNQANISRVSFSRFYPGQRTSYWETNVFDRGEERVVGFDNFDADAEFDDIMGLSMVIGRFFSDSILSDKEAVVVNETFVQEYAISDPFQLKIRDKFHVVGVVKDFHYKSKNHPIGPLVIMNRGYASNCLVEVNSQDFSDLKKSTLSIKEICATLSPDFPVEISFLDAAVESMYQSEIRFRRTFTFFSGCAIFISCLGILALSLFASQRRTKEIGIRKVNGAKLENILIMLNKDFAKWVMLACLIAIPISFFLMSKWLENFAYKTDISWWIFVLGGLAALLIALLTVSWQSWKAARRNPVEALRYE